MVAVSADHLRGGELLLSGDIRNDSQEDFVVGYVFLLLGVFWSMLFLFFWVSWLMLVFRIFGDIFRSDDMGGFAKVVWLVFVVAAPLLGAVVCVIAGAGSMAQCDGQRVRARQQRSLSSIRDAAGGSSSANEIEKLVQLRSPGVLTGAEFGQQKSRILA